MSSRESNADGPVVLPATDERADRLALKSCHLAYADDPTPLNFDAVGADGVFFPKTRNDLRAVGSGFGATIAVRLARDAVVI